LFQDLLGRGTRGNKEQKTEWLEKFNDIRNIVAHPTKAVTVSLQQLNSLEECLDFLKKADAGNLAAK
jgi:hypothetical protein